MSGSRVDPARRFLAYAVLSAATVAAYASLRENGFVSLDDREYVLQNGFVRAGLTWEGVRWAMTSTAAANWHPLTWLSHMLDVELYGLDAFGHHTTSLALHVLASILLWRAFERLTGSFGGSGVVAALFALHPLHVESVAWVSERKDVLSACLFAAALLAYARFAEAPSRARMLAVTVALALGLAAKPMLVTTPFVLLLLDRWPLRRPWSWSLVLEKAPLFAVSALAAVATVLVQGAGGAIAGTESAPLVSRCANAVVAYVRYVEKSLSPVELAVHYPLESQIPRLAVVGATLSLALLAFLAWRAREERPYVPMGLAWFAGMLVPVLGLVQVGSQAFADRYTYLPSLGLFVAVVWLLAERLERVAPVRALVVAGIATTLGFLTHRQVAHWRDSVTLFSHAVSVEPDDPFSRQLLGNALAEAGRFDEALVHMRRAQALRPDFALTQSGLGALLFQLGRRDEAGPLLRAAVKSRPTYFDAWFNLGLWGNAEGDFELAIEAFGRAVALDPGRADAALNLAQLLERAERREEALRHARAAQERARQTGDRALESKARELIARCSSG
jgi:tetratricopeptide (TPR) repeat protein